MLPFQILKEPKLISNAFGRVPVYSVVCLSIVLSNVIVDITTSSRSFVFSQLYAQISARRTNIGSLAVAAFDLINAASCLKNTSIELTSKPSYYAT